MNLLTSTQARNREMVIVASEMGPILAMSPIHESEMAPNAELSTRLNSQLREKNKVPPRTS
jgi:hypothetical protein